MPRPPIKMGLYMPDELLFQILLRLPAKSLARFRCVCKHWHSLISQTHFISSHLNHNNLAGNHKVLFRRLILDTKKELYTLHDDNKQFHALEKPFVFPFKSNWEHFNIIGCVNGLICLWGRAKNAFGSVILWNPAIQKCVTLPEPVFYVQGVKRYLCFGFGYDALADDYKVVGAVFYEGVSGQTLSYASKASVYSLREKSWRRVGFYPPLYIYSRPCTVGGVIYRITEILNRELRIVSFNLSSEVYSEFMCPDEVKSVTHCKTELSIFHESLALLHEWDQKRFHIWVLGENDVGSTKSWTKHFSIDLDEGLSGQHIVGFSKNGLIVSVGEGSVDVTPFVENPQIVMFVPPRPQLRWHVENYVDSLALLGQGDDVLQSAYYNGNDEGSSSI